MKARCRCGTEVQYTYDHLGCIQCGAACCPACSYELESAHYCSSCAVEIESHTYCRWCAIALTPAVSV